MTDKAGAAPTRLLLTLLLGLAAAYQVPSTANQSRGFIV